MTMFSWFGRLNPCIRDWRGKRIWLIGASAGIGAELARQFAQQGAQLALSARNLEALSQLSQELPGSRALALDLQDNQSVQQAFQHLMHEWDQIDLVLIVAGNYQAMRAEDFDLQQAQQLLDINLHGVYRCLDLVLPQLIRQAQGGIGIVASVAGYSGLPKALVYGPSKAALINLCESLYFDLHPKNLAVYLINPGFVATRLTEKNDFKMPALIDTQTAARAIVSGLEAGQFHIHFPKRFTNFLRLARLLPYRSYFYLLHKVTGL